MRRISIALVVAVMAALALTACAPTAPRLVATPPATTTVRETPPTTATPAATGSQETDNSILTGCDGGVAYIRGSAVHVDVAEDCDRIEVEGEDLDIAFGDAEVNHLVIRGARNVFDDVSLVSAEVSGQDNILNGYGIGALMIQGDRNAAVLDGTLGSAAMNGNDNVLRADTIGDVQDNGDRNRVETD